MIPTRAQIQNKLDEITRKPGFSGLRSETYTTMEAWLTEQACPAEDKEKILSDLVSYPEYYHAYQ